MAARTSRTRNILHVVADVLAMAMIMVGVTVTLWDSSHLLTSGSVRLGVPVAIAVLSYLVWQGIYDEAQSRRWPAAVGEVSRAVITGAAGFSLAGFVMAVGGGARRWVVIVSVLWYVFLALHHGLRAALRLNRSRVIVAGSPRQAIAMRDALRRDRRHAYQVVGFVVDDVIAHLSDHAERQALGSLEQLPALVVLHDVDQVVFCMDGLTGGKFAPLARMLNRQDVQVSLTGLGDIAPRRVGINHVEGHPVISISPSVRSGWRLWIKRSVDIVVASLTLLLLAPLMVTVAVVIRLVDGVEPIFRLINVLRGDMSLVGPRPFVESEVIAAPEGFRHREVVTPGMTGQWQVSGRSDTDFSELDELDRWYVDNWSLGQDLEILAKTVPAVLRQKGAR